MLGRQTAPDTDGACVDASMLMVIDCLSKEKGLVEHAAKSTPHFLYIPHRFYVIVSNVTKLTTQNYMETITKQLLPSDLYLHALDASKIDSC